MYIFCLILFFVSISEGVQQKCRLWIKKNVKEHFDHIGECKKRMV